MPPCFTRLLVSASCFLLAAIASVPGWAQADQGQRQAFRFAAIGDAPYELPAEPVKFLRLVAAVNRVAPAFTIHIGDIISGRTQCSDANFKRVQELFATFEQPLVYTPGDNEWTDCHRFLGGGYDPLERLSKIRQMFFADPQKSLGRKPMALQSQGVVMREHFSAYRENQRWFYNGIVFATAHVVGSNNNLQPKRPQTLAEFAMREKANLAWIADTFALARRQKAGGLVLAWQANVHRTPRLNRDAPFSSAYTKLIDAVADGARDFGKPVLVVYGDFHTFDVRPFVNRQRLRVAGVTHLQVFGDAAVHGVLVSVKPESADVFSIQPMIVPGNGTR